MSNEINLLPGSSGIPLPLLFSQGILDPPATVFERTIRQNISSSSSSALEVIAKLPLKFETLPESKKTG